MTNPHTDAELARRERFREQNVEMFTDRRRLLARIESSHGARRRRFERELGRLDARLFEENRGLAGAQLRRWRGATKASDIEELRAVADAALWEAVCSYDLERGPFGQWAQLIIRRALLRAVRSLDHQTLGRADFERRPRILAAQTELADTEMAGDVRAIADIAQVPVGSVERVLGAARLTSLDTPLKMGEEVGETVGGQVADDGTPDCVEELTSVAGVEALERFGLTQLDPREMYVVTRTWGLDGEEPESLASLGTKLGVSREAARQVHNRALSRVLHPIVLRRIVTHRVPAGAPSVFT